ncbi:MAG: hypothetical protein H6835_15255 [Planctomycetes bacterium]|nr:hypothetical protein [Planctomycetota bacterium]
MNPCILLTLAALSSAVAAQLPEPREPVTPRLLPQQGVAHAAPKPASDLPQRRSGARPDARIRHLPDHVLVDRPEAHGPLWLMGHDWKGCVDGLGFTFVPFFGADAPRNFPVRIELTQTSVGGEPLALSPGEPVAGATVVRTDRGALTEVLDLGLRQVEQSFVFATLPNRGAVAVELSFTGGLTGRAIDGGIELGNEHGTVTYHHAVATDAVGASTPLTIDWNGTSAHIEIPASFVVRATLPLVLDPVIQTNLGIASTETNLQTMADIATLQSPDLSCVIWRNQFSAGDQDVFATLLDTNLTDIIGSPVHIDYTFESWVHAAVAGNFQSAEFLVVSQVDVGTTSSIRGRLIDQTGVLGPKIDIERAGTGGSLPGNNFRPDVGGDPHSGIDAYFTVVYEHETAVGNHDIHYRQINQDGTLRLVPPLVLANTSTNESNPSISKSDDRQMHYVAWQRTWPTAPFDEDVHAARIDWNGTIRTPDTTIAGSVNNEFSPSASSRVQVEGTYYSMIAYLSDVSGTDDDVYLRLVDDSLMVRKTLNLSAAEDQLSAGFDQKDPDIDSDGTRFAITYSEPYGGTADEETKVSTVAYDPILDALRIQDNRAGLGLSVSDEVRPRICSFNSGGMVFRSDYVVADVNLGDNDVEVYEYGGYASGSSFTYFASECGTLSISPSGTTTIGGTMTITVGNGALSGTLFGYPGIVPINALGCNCTVGVWDAQILANPLTWTIPLNPGVVGLTLSVQGWTLAGTQCLGNMFDLSDTVDIHIR